MGDSHARLFRGRGRTIVAIGGASATGLRRHDSTTGAARTFRARARARRDRATLVLGGVDCGFVAWVRAQRYGRPVDETVREAVQVLEHFAVEFSPLCDGLALCTTAPPALRDTANAISEKRRVVRVSLEERTRITKLYSSLVRRMVERRGFLLLDIERLTLDQGTGLLKECFFGPPADHHMRPDVAAPVLSAELDRVWAPGREELT